MSAPGWVLLAVAGLLALAIWLAGGRERMHRALAVLPQGNRANAEAVGDAPDPVDEHARTAGVGDSRVAARWADQPVIDAVFAEMVDAHRSQVHNHTDKEN